MKRNIKMNYSPNYSMTILEPHRKHSMVRIIRESSDNCQEHEENFTKKPITREIVLTVEVVRGGGKSVGSAAIVSNTRSSPGELPRRSADFRLSTRRDWNSRCSSRFRYLLPSGIATKFLRSDSNELTSILESKIEFFCWRDSGIEDFPSVERNWKILLYDSIYVQMLLQRREHTELRRSVTNWQLVYYQFM